MPQRAHINPTVIKWARVSSNLDVDTAASKIGVRPERLRDWESGDLRPTIRQAREMARVYRRPLPAFYLPAPPSDLGFSVPRDYRRRPDSPGARPSPELIRELRRIQYVRESALELAEVIPDAPAAFVGTVTIQNDPRAVAKRASELLNVSVIDRNCSHDRAHYVAMNAWKDALERLGILVMHLKRVEVNEVRGVAIAETQFPVIAVNGSDSVNGRIFTLIHEFAHLLLGATGISNPFRSIRQPVTQEDRVEVFCNQVAGEILVPTAALLNEPAVHRAPRTAEWTDAQIETLSHEFGVSREVIVRRLMTAGKTTRSFYSRKRQEYEEEDASSKKRGFLDHTRDIVRMVGQPAMRIAINAYYRDAISASELADLLGTKLKHLPALEMLLEGRNTLTGGDH